MNTVMDESTIVERILNHDHKEKKQKLSDPTNCDGWSTYLYRGPPFSLIRVEQGLKKSETIMAKPRPDHKATNTGKTPLKTHMTLEKA